MSPLVGNLCQPGADMGVRRAHVEQQACLFEGGGQWCDKAALEIAVEALDLAFGLGPVGEADPGTKAKLLG